MKNLIFLVLLGLLAWGCSKDARINNKLEGSWKMESINGQSLPNQFYSERTYEFENLKRKTGRVSIRTVPISGNPYSFFGTYELTDGGNLYIVATDDYGVALSLSYRVESIKNDKIKWVVTASGVEEILIRK